MKWSKRIGSLLSWVRPSAVPRVRAACGISAPGISSVSKEIAKASPSTEKRSSMMSGSNVRTLRLSPNLSPTGSMNAKMNCLTPLGDGGFSSFIGRRRIEISSFSPRSILEDSLPLSNESMMNMEGEKIWAVSYRHSRRGMVDTFLGMVRTDELREAVEKCEELMEYANINPEHYRIHQYISMPITQHANGQPNSSITLETTSKEETLKLQAQVTSKEQFLYNFLYLMDFAEATPKERQVCVELISRFNEKRYGNATTTY